MTLELKPSQTVDRLRHAGKLLLMNGMEFDPYEPSKLCFDIEIIAVALGRECRYGNQTPKHYSVAEHCVHLVAAARSCGDGEYAKEILLHDAREAYGLRDLPAPYKLVCPGYVDLEKRIAKHIQDHFGLRPEADELVDHYDQASRRIERRQLWGRDQASESSSTQAVAEDWSFDVQCWGPAEASIRFLRAAQSVSLISGARVDDFISQQTEEYLNQIAEFHRQATQARLSGHLES